MLPWTYHRPRCVTGYARFFLALGSVAVAMIPLRAQSVDSSSNVPEVPAAPVDTTPIPKPVPAQPAPASAATPAPSEAAASTEISAPVSAAGPTPVSGPGAAPTSSLGDSLNSAALATTLPFRVTATLSEVYNNNIFAARHKVDDFITRASVTGEVRLGALQRGPDRLEDVNFFDLVYTPTGRLYAQHSHENGVDQDVDAIYAHRWTKLTLSLEQLYTSLQTTNASVGGLVTADTYLTKFQADYLYSTKIDLIASFKQEFTSYDEPNYTDSREWSGEFHGLYHVDPKIGVGFGPQFGYLDLHDAPAETFQRAIARANYNVSEKLNFHAEAGIEDRQYQTYKRSDTFEPIFELQGVYLPEPSTNLSFVAARRFTPSYGFVGNDYIATNIYLTAVQRFFNAYYLSLKAGYENDDYAFNLGGPTRRDNYYYISPSVYWKPNGWLQVGAFERYEEDSSNFTDFSYDTNQVGVSCSATY